MNQSDVFGSDKRFDKAFYDVVLWKNLIKKDHPRVLYLGG
jgi:hypothetical protein